MLFCSNIITNPLKNYSSFKSAQKMLFFEDFYFASDPLVSSFLFLFSLLTSLLSLTVYCKNLLVAIFVKCTEMLYVCCNAYTVMCFTSKNLSYYYYNPLQQTCQALCLWTSTLVPLLDLMSPTS